MIQIVSDDKLKIINGVKNFSLYIESKNNWIRILKMKRSEVKVNYINGGFTILIYNKDNYIGNVFSYRVIIEDSFLLKQLKKIKVIK